MQTKAHLWVITLNMKARGLPSKSIQASAKWRELNSNMLSKRVGVLAVQETHLLKHHLPTIEEMYRHLKVFNLSLPEAPN